MLKTIHAREHVNSQSVTFVKSLTVAVDDFEPDNCSFPSSFRESHSNSIVFGASLNLKFGYLFHLFIIFMSPCRQ